MESTDVVIVGGGIAGSGLAAVLVRGGLKVRILEQSREFRDRVRGEIWAPWGAAEAAQLGLLDILTAAGGYHSHRFILYDPAIPVEDAEAGATDLALLPGIPGGLNMLHPEACQALLDAASGAGAEVLRGVDQVSVTLAAGAGPQISYVVDDQPATVQCRLVIGADGRNSTIRRQAGIELEKDDATHLISGLLVDGLDGWPLDEDAFGTVGEVNFFSFPQGPGRCRFYICRPTSDTHRFAGPDGATRFLEAMATVCLPQAHLINAARPAGPCATYPAEDTRCPSPYVPGVVLVGDAAGYSDPITGQGLSMAMRDVRLVSEALLAGEDWSPSAFSHYASERAERMRRVRFTATIMATLFADFGPDAPKRRLQALGRMQQDESLSLWLASILVGPDAVPPSTFEDATLDALIAP
jgi:2-polyprenyl-6-methoxyphenol hydroxylase-like FAD-dependent oxidoreductase